MRADQQKSFQSEYGHARYNHHHGMVHSDRPLGHAGDAVLWVFRKLALATDRFYVLLKYQFYKKTAVAPSTLRMPVLKVGVVGCFAFFVFKDDLPFGLGPGAHKANAGGAFAVAEEVSIKEPSGDGGKGSVWGGLGAIFERKDYFADEPGDDDETRRVKAYIRRFKEVALEEKERYGIPASIKIAQGILETNAGASPLSKKNNNHFGIKCFSRTCKKGHCSNFGDDSHKDFFRKYGSAWESYRAHSKMIVSGKYKALLKHGDDYEKWAHGLKKLGYATAKHYDNTLIDLIEKYHLDELDK